MQNCRVTTTVTRFVQFTSEQRLRFILNELKHLLLIVFNIFQTFLDNLYTSKYLTTS